MRKLTQATIAIAAVLILSLSFVQCTNAKKKIIEAQVTLLNKTCPMKVDEVTTLTGVKALDGDVIEYSYSLTVAESDLAPGFKENMDNSLKQSLGADAAVKQLLDQGIKMTHRYQDKDGKEVYSGTFGADDVK